VSETIRVGEKDNHVIDPNAPSAARVVYDYYGGPAGFPTISQEMMDAVDQADSAQYSELDILAPEGWTLLNYIMDPRTGLNRHGRFTISNNQLMKDMMVYCRRHSIDEILELPDVKERTQFFWLQEEMAEEQIKKHASVDGTLVIIDLRDNEEIFACNRFLIYGLYPDATVSITALPGDEEDKVLFAVGKSILNRSSKANFGLMMLENGGGGHEAVGTCQVARSESDAVLRDLIAQINAAG